MPRLLDESKRKRYHQIKQPSLYVEAGPSTGTPGPSSSRPPVSRKGKERAVGPSVPQDAITSSRASVARMDRAASNEDEGEDEIDAGLDDEAAWSKKVQIANRNRTVRGWSTKTAWARAEDRLLAPDDQTPEPADLPSDDMLLALHAHASAFYASTGLLLPEVKRQRAEPWESRKRRLLESEGVVSSPPTKRGRPRLSERAVRVAPGVQEQHDHEDGRTSRTKGRYIKRDMFQAFEGQALLALGMLVEEHIKQKLYDAGYRPPESVDDVSSRSPQTAATDPAGEELPSATALEEDYESET